jgi:hypothetical protein
MQGQTIRTVTRLLCVGFIATCLTWMLQSDASAQYPVAVTAVQPVVPAVVGYAPQRRGLFGRRVVYRPVVAPVVVARPVVAPVVVARPALAPVVVARPGFAPVVVARPAFAPVMAPPVSAYYAPPVRVLVPVRTYRIPVTNYVPVIGF